LARRVYVEALPEPALWCDAWFEASLGRVCWSER